MAKPNFRQNVAEEMLKLIEKGTAPWQKPWDPNKVRSTPFNPTSEKTYRGMNQFWLEMQGHEDPRWMTYKQAAAMGVQVKKGERATPIEYWKWTEQKPVFDDNNKPKLDDKGKQVYDTFKLNRPQTFRANVFNAEQIEGLAPYIQPALTFDPIGKAEQLLKGTNVVIKHDQADRCFYRGGATDEIHMVPKEGFETAHDYYAIALHEVGHSTGHESRLNRDMGNIFGSEKYAVEELRAEMASYMLTTELGLGHNPERHAPYIKSWMKAIKDDKNILFQAARDAEKITEWVLEKDKRIEMAKGADMSKTAQEQTKEEAKSFWQNSMSDANKLFAKDGAPEQATSNEPPAQQEEKTQQNKGTYQRTYLDVPFKEKEAAKNAGAKWDTDKKKWYVNITAAPGYEKWLPKKDQERPSPAEQKDIAPAFSYEPSQLKPTHTKASGHTVYKPNYNYVVVDEKLKIHLISSLKDAERFRDTQGALYTRSEFLEMIASNGSFAFKDRSGNLSEAMKLPQLVDKIAPNREFNGSQRTLLNRNSKFFIGGKRHSIDVEGLRFQSNKVQHTSEINSQIVSAYIEQEVLAGRNDILVLPENYQEIKDRSKDLEFAHEEVQEKNQEYQQEQKNLTNEIEKTKDQAVEPSPERHFLNVPFKEKNEAKLAGAKWDRKMKSWYAPEGAERLEKWQPENTKVTIQIDPIEEFTHALKDHGLIADKIEMDGKWHRCQVEGDKKGEKSGSYRGFLDGVPNAQIKNFKDGAEAHKWVATGAKISEEERIELSRQSELRKADRERERSEQHAKASKIAYARIMNAPEAKPDHPYLEKKGIKPFGLKLDEKTNALLIPMQDAKGHIWSTQAITEKGDKRFMMNGRKEGLFHVLGELDNKKSKQQTIIIAEGYGTGATVHEATKKAVVVAFDSGNLKPVAEAVRAQHPEAKIVIAADNDHSKKINVGVTKAKEAALAINGEVVIPQFSQTQKARGYTDFNDLGQDKGLVAVGKALKSSKAKQQSMGT